ncbi:MAG: substrate-binding domain-containing protein [Opitutae bacterium]|nr:substrate-binding domain-containing protein [Opitutae bacterium]
MKISSAFRLGMCVGAVLCVGFARGWAAPHKVGVVMKDRSAYWRGFARSAVEAAKELKVEAIAKEPLHLSSPHQVQALQAIAEAGVQALVISPVGSVAQSGDARYDAALLDALKKLRERGVQIVTLNNALPDQLAATCIRTDRNAMTQAGVEAFIASVGERGEAAVFRIAAMDVVVGDRDLAVLKAMKKERPNASLHTDVMFSGTGAEGLVQAERLLAKYPACQTIFAAGYDAMLAMIRVIEKKQLGEKHHVIGFGTTATITPEIAAAIRSGALGALVCVDATAIGRKGMESAVALLDGKTVPAVIEVSHVVVTRANLATIKIQDAETP